MMNSALVVNASDTNALSISNANASAKPLLMSSEVEETFANTAGLPTSQEKWMDCRRDAAEMYCVPAVSIAIVLSGTTEAAFMDAVLGRTPFFTNACEDKPSVDPRAAFVAENSQANTAMESGASAAAAAAGGQLPIKVKFPVLSACSGSSTALAKMHSWRCFMSRCPQDIVSAALNSDLQLLWRGGLVFNDSRCNTAAIVPIGEASVFLTRQQPARVLFGVPDDKNLAARFSGSNVDVHRVADIVLVELPAHQDKNNDDAASSCNREDTLEQLALRALSNFPLARHVVFFPPLPTTMMPKHAAAASAAAAAAEKQRCGADRERIDREEEDAVFAEIEQRVETAWHTNSNNDNNNNNNRGDAQRRLKVTFTRPSTFQATGIVAADLLATISFEVMKERASAFACTPRLVRALFGPAAAPAGQQQQQQQQRASSSGVEVVRRDITAVTTRSGHRFHPPTPNTYVFDAKSGDRPVLRRTAPPLSENRLRAAMARSRKGKTDPSELLLPHAMAVCSSSLVNVSTSALVIGRDPSGLIIAVVTQGFLFVGQQLRVHSSGGVSDGVCTVMALLAPAHMPNQKTMRIPPRCGRMRGPRFGTVGTFLPRTKADAVGAGGVAVFHQQGTGTVFGIAGCAWLTDCVQSRGFAVDVVPRSHFSSSASSLSPSSASVVARLVRNRLSDPLVLASVVTRLRILSPMDADAMLCLAKGAVPFPGCQQQQLQKQQEQKHRLLFFQRIDCVATLFDLIVWPTTSTSLFHVVVDLEQKTAEIYSQSQIAVKVTNAVRREGEDVVEGGVRAEHLRLGVGKRPPLHCEIVSATTLFDMFADFMCPAAEMSQHQQQQRQVQCQQNPFGFWSPFTDATIAHVLKQNPHLSHLLPPAAPDSRSELLLSERAALEWRAVGKHVYPATNGDRNLVPFLVTLRRVASVITVLAFDALVEEGAFSSILGGAAAPTATTSATSKKAATSAHDGPDAAALLLFKLRQWRGTCELVITSGNMDVSSVPTAAFMASSDAPATPKKCPAPLDFVLDLFRNRFDDGGVPDRAGGGTDDSRQILAAIAAAGGHSFVKFISSKVADTSYQPYNNSNNSIFLHGGGYCIPKDTLARLHLSLLPLSFVSTALQESLRATAASALHARDSLLVAAARVVNMQLVRVCAAKLLRCCFKRRGNSAGDDACRVLIPDSAADLDETVWLSALWLLRAAIHATPDGVALQMPTATPLAVKEPMLLRDLLLAAAKIAVAADSDPQQRRHLGALASEMPVLPQPDAQSSPDRRAMIRCLHFAVASHLTVFHDFEARRYGLSTENNNRGAFAHARKLDAARVALLSQAVRILSGKKTVTKGSASRDQFLPLHLAVTVGLFALRITQ